MLTKLNHYGIRGVTLKWFQSYLKNRKQYVTVNDHNSTFSKIVCRVPQGSILGPILFLIYINDLNLISNKLKSIMFADDTNLFMSDKSLGQKKIPSFRPRDRLSESPVTDFFNIFFYCVG